MAKSTKKDFVKSNNFIKKDSANAKTNKTKSSTKIATKNISAKSKSSHEESNNKKSNQKKSSPKKYSNKKEEKSIRINAYIAQNCPYSRRQADELISQNRVKIKHKIATLGDIVFQGEKVFIDGKPIKEKNQAHFSAIVYHKPKGELVSRVDSLSRRVIYDSLGEKFKHFVPVGRLDFASEGLLILSDSKRVVDTLSKSALEREYILKIDSAVSPKMLEAMQNGLSLKNAKKGAHRLSKITAMDFAPFIEVQIIKNTRSFSRLKVVINEGQNRELRRFFAHFEAKVLDLRRVRFGFVSLNALPVGKTRFFSKQEYKDLKEFLKT